VALVTVGRRALPSQILQERLTAEGYRDPLEPERKHVIPTATLNLIQSGVAVIVSGVLMVVLRDYHPVPVSKFMIVGFTTIIASPFGCTLPPARCVCAAAVHVALCCNAAPPVARH
jgi:hypothetical protein